MSNAKDEADEFDVEFVRPALEEFERDRMSRRKGVIAALVVNSFADHIFEARCAAKSSKPENDKANFIVKHLSLSQDFRTVREVANAAKHAVVRKWGKGPEPDVKKASDIQADSYVEDDYVEEGYFEEGVFVSDKLLLLLPILHKAVEYLRALP